MRLAVIGTGHVGLVTCVTLAHIGHEVVGTDIDAEKIEALERGAVPLYEPGLQELLDEGLASGRLSFMVQAAPAIAGAEAAFISVGTPPRASGEADLVAVESSASAVARHALGPIAVVEKSTVPSGTFRRLKQIFRHVRPDLADDIEVVSNPEFLREGSAVADSLHPDRILVGAESERAFDLMRRIYRPLVDGGVRLIETDIGTAELAKHACNAFLALKISYANALARLCERADADVLRVAEVMGSDPRIGPDFLRAGLGYGGSCFPKDLLAFERLAHDLGYSFPLLREIALINEEATRAALAKIKDAVSNLDGKRICLLGLAFKPGTDDVRFAPALSLARLLLQEGAAIVGYDPKAMTNAKAELEGLELAPDAYEAARGADCVVICTEWDEFAALDLDRLRSVAALPVVIDGRNVFSPQEMRAAGFTYLSVGRPPVYP